MRKFLERIVRLVDRTEGLTKSQHGSGAKDFVSPNIRQALALAAKKVAEDGDRFKFNTGIAALMTLLNELEKEKTVSHEAVRDFTIMLAPFAPHLAEHLWRVLGQEGSVHQAPWPTYDPTLLVSEEVTVVVQVSGKRRGELTLAPDAPEAEALEAALALASVKSALSGKHPSRTIYRPGRILNLVP